LTEAEATGENGTMTRAAKTIRKRRTRFDILPSLVIRVLGYIPVGQSIKAHGTLNRLDKCAASAFTPKTSVA
jgi:hypothetical protein